MAIELRTWTQPSRSDEPLVIAASTVASDLASALSQPDIEGAIAEANLPGRSSGRVQDAFSSEARRLGFRSEAKGLFSGYTTSALRPDYYLPIGDSGILLEVERGKTTINNMDLLDFWKCHICEHANVLFLMVPNALRQNETMTPRPEFQTVSNRLEAFFAPGNETNVWALHLFGY